MPKKKIVSITMDEDILAWVDESAAGASMSRSEFISFVLSGGRDSAEMLDTMIENLFNQKKTEFKDALKVPIKAVSRVAKKEER